MATFVLVHGAWHGGWCWQRVAKQLINQGHEVFTPSLTGLGDRAHLLRPEINLSTHLDDIAYLLRSYDLADVVLCGHSYGGFVITGVADRSPNSVRSLVYLDALIPKDGQCMFDTIPQQFVDVLAAGAADGDGFSVPPMTGEQFAVNAADIAWMNEKCTNHPIGCFTERIKLTKAYQNISSRTYVLASGFDHPSTKAHYSALEPDETWRTLVMTGGHDLMIDNPGGVANILLAEV